MIGLHQPIEPAYSELPEADNKVIGIIASSSFPDPQFIETTVRRGIMANPGAVWACAATDRVTVSLFERLELPYVALPLNPYWQRRKSGSADFDVRRMMRDVEMMLCDELLVFQKVGCNSSWKERAESRSNVYVIEQGEAPKARARRGRKPVGA